MALEYPYLVVKTARRTVDAEGSASLTNRGTVLQLVQVLADGSAVVCLPEDGYVLSLTSLVTARSQEERHRTVTDRWCQIYASRHEAERSLKEHEAQPRQDPHAEGFR